MPTTPPVIGHPRWTQSAIDEEGSRSGRAVGGKSGLSRSFCVAAPMEGGERTCAYWHLLVTWPLGGKPSAQRDGWLRCGAGGWSPRSSPPRSRRSWRSLFPAEVGVSEPGGEALPVGSLVGLPKVSPSRLCEALALPVPFWERPQRSPIRTLGASELPGTALPAPPCPPTSGRGRISEGCGPR